MAENFDDAVSRATEEINQATKPQPPLGGRLRPNEPPENRFMTVSDRLTELLLETARAHLTRAENHVKQVELEVAAIKERSKRMWEQLEAYNKELDEYSHEAIQIHERFARKGNSK